MARTDKREGRVKYGGNPLVLSIDQRKAQFGKFHEHALLESVLICENRKGIEGSTPLNDLTPAEFAKGFESKILMHRKLVAAFKKKNRKEYDEMLRAIDMNDGDGVDPRRRFAIEEYHKIPLAIHTHRGVVYAVKPTRLRYVKGTGTKVGKKLRKASFRVEEGTLPWRYRPARDFQEHLEKLYPRHFPATETADSFMIFAKRAGLRFIGPKNAKTRKISKRLKQ